MNPYLGNPYMGMYGSPFPMKSPEQYQAELMAQVQPQMAQYRQMYDASQAKMKAEESSGTYFKVSSYEEMMAIQTPAEGRPIMVLDEQSGRLYSKRFENGRTYVTGFQLVPLDGEKPQGEAKASPSLEETLSKINARLEALEGKNEPAGNAPQ